jgi:hypothetical protein
MLHLFSDLAADVWPAINRTLEFSAACVATIFVTEAKYLGVAISAYFTYALLDEHTNRKRQERKSANEKVRHA